MGVRSCVQDTGPLLVDLARAFAGLDKQVQNKNVLAFRDAFFGIGKAIGWAVKAVVGGFKLMVAAIKPVADAVNNLFGTQITAGEIVAYAAILQLIGAFRLLFSLATGIGALASPWTLVVVAIGAVLVALGYLAYKYWPEIKQAVADATQWMKDKFGDAWTVVAGAAATAAVAGIIYLIGLIPGALGERGCRHRGVRQRGRRRNRRGAVGCARRRHCRRRRRARRARLRILAADQGRRRKRPGPRSRAAPPPSGPISRRHGMPASARSTACGNCSSPARNRPGR